MTVPRTSAQLARAAPEAGRWLDEPDPAGPSGSGADHRTAGHPWRQIAAVLGTSRQAVPEKHGHPATTVS